MDISSDIRLNFGLLNSLTLSTLSSSSDNSSNSNHNYTFSQYKYVVKKLMSGCDGRNEGFEEWSVQICC